MSTQILVGILFEFADVLAEIGNLAVCEDFSKLRFYGFERRQVGPNKRNLHEFRALLRKRKGCRGHCFHSFPPIPSEPAR